MKATEALKLYRAAPLATRAFLRTRVLLSDLDFVERHVPDAGDILDLGCGHGLFANMMALDSRHRHVTGIDLSCEKIGHAQATVGKRDGIRFLCGDILTADLSPCDVITIVDVMYLLPRQEQEEILNICRQKLKPGGLLVWKAQETSPRWKYAWTHFQELLATSIGVTQGKRERLCFLSRRQALEALEGAGFAPSVVEMPTRRPYTDILYLARC